MKPDRSVTGASGLFFRICPRLVRSFYAEIASVCAQPAVTTGRD